MTFRFLIWSSILILLTGFIYSQDSESLKKTQFKLYYNGSIQTTEETEFNELYNAYYRTETVSYDFGGLSFAFEIDKGRFLSHEIEFLPILINIVEDKTLMWNTNNGQLNAQYVNGNKIYKLKTATRYQVNHTFIKDKVAEPYLGLSGQLYGIYYKNEPKISSEYLLSKIDFGFLISIVPGLIVNITNNLAFDINFPIDFYNISYNWIYNQNPSIPLSDQKQSEIVGDIFPKIFNLRLGLIYKF